MKPRVATLKRAPPLSGFGLLSVDAVAIDAHAAALARFVATGGALMTAGFQGPGTQAGDITGTGFGFLSALAPALSQYLSA